MANSTATELVLKSQYIYPRTGNTLPEKLKDCYNQLGETNNFPANFKETIVRQSIFISVDNNAEYLFYKKELLACSDGFFDNLPPTSIIAQQPDNGSLIVEFTSIEGLNRQEVEFKKNEKASWLVVERCDAKMIFVAGLGEASENTDILKQSTIAFESLESVLKAEDFEFCNIIRQWNYIEEIIKNVSHNNAVSQHYQIFNDVRSKYYQKSNFIHGYPAATGIGQAFGGVIIDAIAVQTKDENSIIPIKSPLQLDAYSYTNEVLAENNKMSDFRRTSPKFERAKLIITSECKCIFVSGTAAIKGQTSIPELSVERQTEMTIQNIHSLISNENILKYGLCPAEKASLISIRVYIKKSEDISVVREICNKYFLQLPVIYVVADICRPELLVEIEGFATIG